ncbi:MAG: DNA cytosine methyltransferase [Gammaproteobacteria bacterium]|nr:DNA cytosine methyltransferase [Gammaproteobacteria bacterium]
MTAILHDIQQSGLVAASCGGDNAPIARSPLFVDVFAGAGGLSLGLKRAGWKGIFAIEKDACAFKTLSANFPADESLLSYDWPKSIERKAWDIHDLLSMREESLDSFVGKVDLLAGGPPCQGFSHAGRRQPEDPRNRLFEAYLELVRILRPRLVLVENVRGFESDFKAKDQKPVKNFAVALRKGLSNSYDVASAVIQSRDFGVPQARPRFFLVGALKELCSKEGISSFFDDLERHVDEFLEQRGLPRWPSAKEAISDLEISRNGTVDCIECKGFQEIAYKAPLTSFQRAMRDGHEGAPSDMRLARHRPDIRNRFSAIIKSCHEEGRLNVTISPKVRKAHKLKKMAIRVLDPLNAAPTVTSLPDDLLHYSEPRILTVRETARLQSFPDWFSFKGNYTTGGHRRRNEVPRFTQVANAVPPLLAEQLGLALTRIVLGFRSTELPVQRFADDDQSCSVSQEFLSKV